MLLLNNRAWEQHELERALLPDENQAYLEIKYGSQGTGIWEWYNDLEENKRIGIIRNFMQDIAGLNINN